MVFFYFKNKDNKKNEKNVIEIGALIFQTGGASQYGKWVMNGLEMAKNEINEQGGINGDKIELIYEDDKSEATTAVTVFSSLISKHNLPIVIAGLTSKSTLAIAPIADKNNIVLFSPCSSSPDLTNSGDYIFRNWPSDNEEGRLMAEYSYKVLNYRNIGIVSINNDYGLGLEKVFERNFLNLGGNIVFKELFQENCSDFRVYIDKLKKVKIDALYVPSHAKEVALFLKQLEENNMKYQILGCVTYESPELIKISGKSAEGVIFTTPSFNSNSNDSLISSFVSKYEKLYGDKPENFAAQSYDALKIISIAIKHGGYTSNGIKDQLYKIKNYNGVSGITTFDVNGDVIKPAIIKKVINGEFVIIDAAK